MSINKTHAFSEGANGFQISPHLQELLLHRCPDCFILFCTTVLCADSIFTDQVALKKWTDKQKELLLQSKVTKVIGNIKRKNCESKDALSIINYYVTNAYRMDYQRYKNIGAGIIEFAN